MFAGVWCMMQIFTHFTDTSSLNGVGAVAERLINDKGNVDDFMMSGSVSEYDIINYEDSVAMSNEGDFDSDNQ